MHFLRNLLAHVPKREQATVAAVGRTIFQHRRGPHRRRHCWPATVAAVGRTIFQPTGRRAAEAALERVVEALATSYPKVVELLAQPELSLTAGRPALATSYPKVVELLVEAAGEVLTFSDFPAEHRRQLASTKPLERLDQELKRRSAVVGVGIFPNRPAVIRLLGAVQAEQQDAGLVGRHDFSEGRSLCSAHEQRNRRRGAGGPARLQRGAQAPAAHR